jgi:Putative zinc-finger
VTATDPRTGPHTDVAAYALGLLEEPERSAFERHLEACPSCTAEHAELSGLRPLLAGIPPAAVVDPLELRPPRPAQVVHPRWWRRDGLAHAAAAVVLIIVGFLIGSWVAGGDEGHGDNIHRPAGELLLYGERRSATDAATGVTGIVGLEDRGFGTHVALELRGVPGPERCRLVAVSRTGAEETVVSWAVPDRGYGVPGAPDPLVIHGGTAFARPDIARFEIDADGRGTILTIPL